MNIKTALIFGVTGQDGSYLAEFLLIIFLRYSFLQKPYEILIF